MIAPEPRTLIYQIFPDRFAKDDGGPTEAPWLAEAMHDPGHSWRQQLHLRHAGGTLRGIAKRLDHIRALGADCVYMTPIFPADSNHKYDAADFLSVDERFGGMTAFDALADACQSAKMGLILDAVFNHTGRKHSWFQAALSGQGEGAGWYRLPEAGVDAEKHYGCWRGHASLPELRTELPQVRQRLLHDADGPLRFWLQRGATGWRLDCANDLGYGFCAEATEVAAGMRAQGGHAADGVAGEVMNFAAEWTQHQRLDAVMNYWFRETMCQALEGRASASQVRLNLSESLDRFAPDALCRSWNMLSSHDTPRLAHLFPDRRHRDLALAMAFFFPGVPVLYYGEEVGMVGGADPDNRRPMVWDGSQWDHALLAEIRHLAQLRASLDSLRLGHGRMVRVPESSPIVAFVRYLPDRPEDFVVVAANFSANATEQVPLFVAHPTLFDGLPLDGDGCLRDHGRIAASGGRIDLPGLPPFGWTLLRPHPEAFPRYSFFKPRLSS